MKITAVIPTRAGSERVKQKNIRKFGDTNLLRIKIEKIIELKRSGYIDSIILNSNCPLSWEIASEYNINIHKREEFYASSECPITEYWRDAARSISTDTLLLAQVTSPFISLDTYKRCIEMYKTGDYDSLMTVKKLNEYVWHNDKPLNYSWPDHPRSQDLQGNLFYLTFGVCIADKNKLITHGNLVGKNPHMYELEGIETVDIDTEFDFDLAQKIYKQSSEIYKAPLKLDSKPKEQEYFLGHEY
jgi:CMP-N,N'-diacetyllegionaminic acid synthase